MLLRQTGVPRDFLANFEADITGVQKSIASIREAGNALAREIEQGHTRYDDLKAVVSNQALEHDRILSQAKVDFNSLERRLTEEKEKHQRLQNMIRDLQKQREQDQEVIQVCYMQSEVDTRSCAD